MRNRIRWMMRWHKGWLARLIATGRSDWFRLTGASVLVLGLCAFAASSVLESELRRIGPPPLAAAEEASVVVLDRDGRLLRAFTTDEGRWRLPVRHTDVDQRYLRLLFAFEDKRFYAHSGVDMVALVRAGWQFLRSGRIVSGGSTLTMQVARLLDQRHERTARGKWHQILRAIQLERRLTKDGILDLYLKLAPFGGNLEGVRAASLAYFGKEPRRLSLGQAALLVALPQSPERRRPDILSHHASARIARQRVLERALKAQLISAAQLKRAIAERLPSRRIAFPKYAPHLSETYLANAETKAGSGSVIHLTLDRQLQGALERLARRHVQTLGSRLSAAILVVDHHNGDVLAHVGSAGYLDRDRFGAIDMVHAVRSPGSALKPAIYGMAFDRGLAHPQMLIDDKPTRFGGYTPKNFDEAFHGTVTVREALARSLNIPAVKMLDRLGPGRFLGALRKAGIETTLPVETEPSLAVALGGVGMTLHELTAVFAATARGGQAVQLVHQRAESSHGLQDQPRSAAPIRRLISSRAAYQLTDILRDAPPPPNARGGRIAFKTGTSYGYRDAWAIGFDGHHTIGVWVGRPDMASTPGLLGRTAAAPILFDAFVRVSPSRTPFPDAPQGMTWVVDGAALPPPLRRFEQDDHIVSSGSYIEQPVAIAFPPDRAEMETASSDALLLKADGGQLPLTWLVDGAPIGVSHTRRQLMWQPSGTGFRKLAVIDAAGQVDRVTVRLNAP